MYNSIKTFQSNSSIICQHIIYDKDIRIAKPDFYYKQQNIALFVDGPSHEEDYVKRDDAEKRKKLKALGYRVYTIHHANIEDGITRLASAVWRQTHFNDN